MNLTPQDAKRLADVLLSSDVADILPEVPSPRLPPGPFSRYRITRLVGIGGMGEVYEAQQDNPARRVAIKVIRPDLVSPDLLRRFEHETRILARLQHPGIAPIYEAGKADTPSGPMPFFAMEYVDGRPLTAFVTDSNLPIRARLELFLLVCDAVEHAHRKGIIHRDLKPANILIDALGQPRILDFGVARATDADIRTTTLHTEVGKLLGTLPYMSPEQAGGDPDELDTRSDVYSLGVILYELLSGRVPFEFKPRAPVPQAVRVILESDPAPLSSVSRGLRGDLETIVGKALAKETARRYQSVADLADDLRRFTRDEPIVARRPSTWYHLRKLTRRQPGLVAGIGTAFMMLVVGTTVSTYFAFRERAAHGAAQRSAVRAGQAQLTAERKATQARATLEFIQDAIASAVPNAQGRDVRVSAVMDSARESLDRKPLPDPGEEATLREAIGTSYVALGNLPEGVRQLRTALELRERQSGPDDPDTILTLLDLATATRRSRDGNSQPLYRQALERSLRVHGPDHQSSLEARRGLAVILVEEGKTGQGRDELESLLADDCRVLGPEHDETCRAMTSLGLALLDLGQPSDAERTFRQLVATSEAAHGERHTDTVTALNNLAIALELQSKLDEAESTIVRALSLARDLLGDTHPTTLELAGGLATVYRSRGDLDRAEAEFRTLLAASEATRGQDHPATLAVMSELGSVLKDKKRFEEAAALFSRALEVEERTLGEEDPQTLGTMDRLAGILGTLKDFDRALPLARRMLALTTRVSGPTHPDTLLSMNTVARVLKDKGDLQEAADLWQQTLVLAQDAMPSHWYTHLIRTNYGRCLSDLGRYDDAERELLAAFDGFNRDGSIDIPRARGSIDGLVALYEKRNNPDQAAKYRAMLPPDPQAPK